ncbi:hypothetical protein [Bacillus sp. 7884-1]|uniref:hypothetical protein n=1 Tax=Bacillus sp. 7884-1 TaxID=2021693 RepID=UPI0015C6EF42|nr:hypothetical protein [Bacillus sp. 7884-1]
MEDGGWIQAVGSVISAIAQTKETINASKKKYKRLHVISEVKEGQTVVKRRLNLGEM